MPASLTDTPDVNGNVMGNRGGSVQLAVLTAALVGRVSERRKVEGAL